MSLPRFFGKNYFVNLLINLRTIHGLHQHIISINIGFQRIATFKTMINDKTICS